MNKYSVVMVFVSSILTLQQKYIEIMKVTCKKTGKNMTGKVIESIERQMISEGIKLFKVTFTRDENGNLVQHKTPVTYDE